MTEGNFISVPTQEVVGHKSITVMPVPITRWHFLQGAIRRAEGTPWVQQQLAAACLGLGASATLGRFSSSISEQDRTLLTFVAIATSLISLALYVGVRKDSKNKSLQISHIIQSMEAIEESLHVPPCPAPTNPKFGYRVRAAIKSFKNPP